MSGEIERFSSYELPEEEKIVDSYQVERFEYHFIKMPCPLQAGTPVKDIRNGSYYVLVEGETDWDRYLERIEEKNWYVDFSDIQMICYKLTESGIWSHEHINPLYLEVEFPTCIEDDPKRQALRYAMEALGDYLSHKSNGKEFCPDLVLKYARKYAEVCRKKSLSENMLEEAKFARKMLEEAEMNLAERICQMDETEITTEVLTIIEESDISDVPLEERRQIKKIGFAC